ncbi:unnamed protein product [Cylicostephanus goldi]|uniref:Uncharacterized protein n=1 Tax=Cylicostephanus goldi TaxID=71465 RepID=A0A3P7Q5P2_CYLGO|nr:unnamed protein product [Cylicostephanus goldi]
MYLDGVPIKDFDQFVRNRNLEDRFSTKQPPSTTTPIPSANDIAAAVYDKLKTSLPTSIPQPPATERKFPVTDEFSRNLDVAMIDPSRLQEVNTLLRRAPQRFENPLAHAPGPFMQTIDPEVDEVVTSLRTGSVMDVERIRQLQNILQTYEQGLQTKELIAKRKQLQLLQNELVQQRKKIEEQRRMEEELRKKEQELELQRRAMEIQLREQLNQWHNSFSNVKDRNSLLVPMDLPELSAPASSLVAQPPAPMEVLPETNKVPHVEIPKEIPTMPPMPTTAPIVMTPPPLLAPRRSVFEQEA